jgi:hypothetical protein
MRRIAIACSALCLFIAATSRAAEGIPEMPKPQKEHEWLAQFAGDWDYETEVKPPGSNETMKFKGEEHSHMVGGFWLVGHNEFEMLGTPCSAIMTIGYDTKAKNYIGTWIDSMGDYLWEYKGKADGNKLTIEAKGPCPMKPPGTMVNFRETLELKDKDHKVFTSSYQEDDGSWTHMLTSVYTRKKK